MLREFTSKLRGWLQRSESTPTNWPQPGAGAVSTDEANRLCQAALRSLSDNKASEALTLLNEALAIHPDFAEAHNHSGLALRALGRLEEAATCFQRATKIRPDYESAITNLGIVCLELQRFEEAEDCFKLALSFDAESAEACFNLGMICLKRGVLDQAKLHFLKVIELDSGFTPAYVNLGEIYSTSQQPGEALKCYERAVVLSPEVPEIFHNKALILQKLGRIAEAVSDYRRALANNPDFAEAHYNLGNAYLEQERFDAAVDCYERAITFNPDLLGAYNNLGKAFRVRGKLDESLSVHRRALTIWPNEPQLHNEIGATLFSKGQIEQASASYERVLVQDANYAQAHLNLGFARLMLGDMTRGWDKYEWRFRQPSADNIVNRRDFPYPQWRGEALAAKRLLIWGEQGIGDEIMFAGLYQEVIDRTQYCLIECARKLEPLFRRSFPGAQVVAKREPPDASIRDRFDYQTASGSLARWLRPSIDSFPARAGYLQPDPTRVAYWSRRIAELGDGLKVGFSWRSCNLKGERALACTRIEQWGAIFAVPGMHFVNLQYDDCSAELVRAQERFGILLNVFPEVDLFNDLDEAAALMMAM